MPGSSGGSDDVTETALSDFLDPEADSLLAKVDFAGMISNFARSTVLAFFTGVTGVVLAIQRNVVEFMGAWREAVLDIYVAIVTVPAQIVPTVFQNAEADLAQFGFLATPVGVLVLLSVLLTAAFMLDLFLGGDG